MITAAPLTYDRLRFLSSAETVTVIRGCFIVGLVLQSRMSMGQNTTGSYAGIGTVPTQVQQASPDYTFKSGDFRILARPSMSLSWNDNITLQKVNPQSDVIVRPTMEVDASYPITDWNLLQLNVNCGYDNYINHSELSRLYIASGSQLSFDVFVKQVHFNVHDAFSYSQDSATEPAVSGTGNFGSFENVSGISAAFPVENLSFVVGYDYRLSRSTAGQFDYLNLSSANPYARALLPIYPGVTVGVESSGAITSYAQSTLNDSSSWTAGLYAEWKPDSFLSVTPRFGYNTYYFQQTSTEVPASDQSSWYADLSIRHDVTSFLTCYLSAGHELQTGVESDLIEDYYVKPNLQWNVVKNASILTSFQYERGSQRGGQLSNNFGDNYSYYGFDLSLMCSPVKRLQVTLYYRLTYRRSDVATAEYMQNVVGFSLAYAIL